MAMGAGLDRLHLLSPADLQAIKASGVTFAESMVERVIEEQAAGNPDLAAEIRTCIGARVGDICAASCLAPERRSRGQARAAGRGPLVAIYLEVGIGPDAEIFTKCQPMASVGWGADVGRTRSAAGTTLSRKSCWPWTAAAGSGRDAGQ